MSTRRTIATIVVLACLPAASAQAAYGPGADIVSADFGRLEQGDDATQNALITPDGRYVVLQTRATNFFADDDPDPAGATRRGGIFRFDRQTRRIELVADGNMFATDADGAQALRGAANPSVSDDGRYVVFSTAQQLVPQDTNDNIDVYVRDMTVPVGVDRKASGAYTLVSAKDGGDVPAGYAPAATPLAGGDPGADVWRNTAISADGRRVAFRTASDQASDLPDHAEADVPGGQVFVRDLATHRTTLVTRRRGDGTPAGGASGPTVLSGDGSTVVWVGSHAPTQVPFLNGEHIDQDVNFYLWQRLDGPTRRLTGMVDPDDPWCDGSAVTLNAGATGPCYGPLTGQEEDGASLANVTPTVSQDGYRIAFLTTGGVRPSSINNPGLDAFVTDMHPGLTRKASTTELTRDGTGLDARSTAGIDAIAMSKDGEHLALATARTNFLLPSFAPVGTFRSVASAEELYVFDLGLHTIDRVVRSLDGGDAGGDAGTSPSLTADGSTVAFVSKASNLFYGDANAVADAFVTTLVPPVSSGTAPPSDGGKNTGDGFVVEPDPTLQMDAVRRKDGGLDVSLVVPGAGTARVTASASIAKSRAGKTAKVVVATGTKTAKRKGTVTVVLKLAKKYAGLLKRSKRVAVTLSPSFTPKGAKAAVTDRSEAASFVRPKAVKKKPAKKKPAKKKTPAKKKSS